MKFAREEVLGLILILLFYIISIPLTIYWLIQYKVVASTKHTCITSRHFNTTWGYLICCVYSSNIGHPLSIILYYLHINVSTSTIVYSYLLSDISTFLMFYLSLTRCYMIMWDKKYNLALKEQFWTTKIVNDELETYNEFENQSHALTDNISKFIKYRSTLGNVKYISIFMCCIATPLTILFIISPFIIAPNEATNNNHNINIKLSSIFRFVCTIPIVSIIVFIYFNIPKYNEYIALKFEIRAIVQIICGTFVASNLLISFLLYSLTNMINSRFLMLINGNIQIIASFLLFYTSTGFILPKLRKIIMNDPSFNRRSNTPNNNNKNRLHLVFTSSDHKAITTPPNKNNISSLPVPGHWTQDPSISAEKKLRKTITIWRRRKDMKTATTVTTTTTTTEPIRNHMHNNNKYDHSAISPPMSFINDDFSLFDGLPPQYDNKMPSAFSETFTNNRIHPHGHIQHTHIDTITSQMNIDSPKTIISDITDPITVIENINTHKRFEIIHTPVGGSGADDMDDEFGEIIGTNLDKILNGDGDAEIVVNEMGVDVSDGEYETKGYSHSKQTSNTHIFTSTTGLHSSAAIITPQISKTSNDSKANSRRTSSKFNALELLNINTSINSSNHSNKSSKQFDTPRSSSKKRRASLSVKDAYAGIKQIISGHSYSNKNNIQKIILIHPLHIILSDEEGLSHFADHLCAEFSIENLLFIVEALQYRYCIPIYLFENNQNEEDIINNDINNSESCELLMHIINQNKKLPISKLLKQHQHFCIQLNAPSINIIDTPINENNQTPIRRKSTKKQEKCCKKCIVEKFKYIIEKYVETTSINLPSAIQLKLINIWKQLQIKEPQNRFIDTAPQIKQHNREISHSKSKSKSKSKSRKNSVYDEDEINKIEQEENNNNNKMEDANKRQTVSKSNSSENNHIEMIEHPKEQIPSHSVSPRVSPIDVNTSTDLFPNNNPQYKTNNASHISNSISHVSTNTPITNNTNERTPTEMDDEEPLPASPIDCNNKPKNNNNILNKCNETNNEQKMGENINDITDGMAPTNSMQELKGNGILAPITPDDEKEKENENENENEDTILHDGFGNINYITVFDDAILEIMKLIKSDTWGRFKRSKQFVDWANNF